MKKAVAYMIVTDENTILYPPLLEDDDTDFFVLTNIHSLQSQFWQIKQIDSLPNCKEHIIENPSYFLGNYDKYIYINHNDIVIGLLSEDGDPIVSVPPMEDFFPIETDLIPPINHTAEIAPNPSFTDGVYNGYPFQLSICLPMGNRLETVEKCLLGVKPLLDAIDAELIVVDSSSDGSSEIARKYTDKIIPYTWVDDFSHARNTAVSAAQGSWILSIDDDECFENPEEIVVFFKSGDYLEYDGATYITRNYTTLDGKLYTDFSVLRMAKNHAKLHYRGCVHESFDLTFINHPLRLKNFEAFVHHYGYAYQNNADEKKKFYRNIKGLYFDLIEQPLSLQLQCQLCNELMNSESNTAAVAYCFRLLALCKIQKPTRPSDADHYRQIATIFLYNLAQKSGDLELAETLSKVTDLNSLNTIQRGTVCYLLAFLYFNQQDYEKTCSVIEEYYLLRNEFLGLSSKNQLLQAQDLVLDLLKPEVRLNSIYFIHAYVLLKLDKFNDFEKCFQKIDFDLLDEPDSHTLEGLWKLSDLSPHKASLIYGKLLKSGYGMDNLYADFLGLLSLDSNYPNLLKNMNQQDMLGYVSSLGELPPRDYEQLTCRYLDCLRKDMTTKNTETLSLHEIFFYSALLEILVFKKNEFLLLEDSDKYLKYFHTYADMLFQWSISLYSEEIRTPERIKMLPSNIRGVLFFKAALESKESGNLSGYMNCLKSAVVECPLYADIAKLLLKRLVEGV